MFGLVPRAMWSKLLEPNDRGTIRQNANCLLLQTEQGAYGLVDTGCGSSDLFTERERTIHALGDGWPLAERLHELGVGLDEISFVLCTHLHWDHAGGLTRLVDGKPALSFPNATYTVHAREWACATGADPLLGHSYPPAIKEALARIPSDRLNFIDEDEAEILPGVRMVRSGGHTEGHCAFVFDGQQVDFQHPDAAALDSPGFWLFACDECPTQHHLRMVFQTSYDTYPLATRAWKRTWLPRVEEEGGVLLFCHDPDVVGVTLKPEKRTEFAPVMTLPVLDDVGHLP